MKSTKKANSRHADTLETAVDFEQTLAEYNRLQAYLDRQIVNLQNRYYSGVDVTGRKGNLVGSEEVEDLAEVNHRIADAIDTLVNRAYSGLK